MRVSIPASAVCESSSSTSVGFALNVHQRRWWRMNESGAHEKFVTMHANRFGCDLTSAAAFRFCCP